MSNATIEHETARGIILACLMNGPMPESAIVEACGAIPPWSMNRSLGYLIDVGRVVEITVDGVDMVEDVIR